MGKRAPRIRVWPGVIHSNKGRIHLRRPTCDILTFRLRRSGGPYIPACSSSDQNHRVETARCASPNGLTIARRSPKKASSVATQHLRAAGLVELLAI